MSLFLTLCVNSLLASSLYLLIGLGFMLLYFTRAFFDLSYGVLIPIGGYTALVFQRTVHVPFWIGAIAGVCLSAFVAFFIGKFIYDPLRVKGTSRLCLIVASMGVMSVLQAVLAILFSSRFQFLEAFETNQQIVLGTISITLVQAVLCGAAVMVSVVLWVLLRKTRFGKTVRAMHDDAQVAQAIGIHTQRVTDGATLMAGAIAGLAGVLIGIDTGLEPTMGLALLLKGVTSALLGGLQGPVSVFAGSFFLGSVEQIGVWSLPAAWKNAIVFGVLLLVLKVQSSRTSSR